MRHRYTLTLTWTGNLGAGTSHYKDYARDHTISAPGKSDLLGSADGAFRGDRERWNPEELLVASLSACHKLWFLHECVDAGVVVTSYRDTPVGEMRTHAGGAGEFVSVVLRPDVGFAEPVSDGQLAALHAQAHAKCFIARSVNFPVTVATTDGSPPR
ncbi:MAG: OsmC family protein [Pseudomonadota bacterium]